MNIARNSFVAGDNLGKEAFVAGNNIKFSSQDLFLVTDNSDFILVGSSEDEFLMLTESSVGVNLSKH